MESIELRILAFLKESSWMHGDLTCTFLAAGEYNENYLVSNGRDQYVFRINHGTQLGLENQIEYEFQALSAVRASGVTPAPYFCDPVAAGLGKGALLMEYLPGRVFDYSHDTAAAAEIFARLHRLPADERLIRQSDPVAAIAAESLELITRYDGARYRHVRSLLLEYHGQIAALTGRVTSLSKNEGYCIVNTEVNSGNFIVGEHRTSLVDWEKAVVSCRYQDLAHFLAPTTTMWKTDFRFTDGGKRQFLQVYLDAYPLGISLDEICEKTSVMERVILLRALSWCYMAFHEYISSARPLTHNDTFTKISKYLNEAECFLR